MTQDELLQLIDQAAQEGWTELDLSNQGLTELPQAIGRLAALEKLNLGYDRNKPGERNHLTTLPSEIGQLTTLQVLDLSENNLTDLPPEIGRLTALQSLNLRYSNLMGLPPEIGRLIALREIDLLSNEFRTLPSEIGQLAALQSLILSGNYLKSLPPEIGRLAALTNLELRFNILTALPPEICQLTTLQTLDLYGNNLGTFPPGIGQLTALRKLNLGRNHLTALHPEIGQLTALRELNLEENNLKTIPLEFGQLATLQSLGLRRNHLTTLPPEIGRLTNLCKLDLSRNRLTVLPPEVGQLTALQSLRLGGNSLIALPLKIGQLTALRELDLSGNRVTTLPPEIGQLTALQSLNLDANRLAALPPEISLLSALQTLELGDNDLTTLPPEIGRLTDLRSLGLAANALTVLPPEVSQLIALQSLGLNHNGLMTLPAEIGLLTTLQSLDLDANHLTALPPEIGHLIALQSLELGHNGLTTLPPEIGQLTTLQSLDLDNNRLAALPPEIGQLTTLQSLDLANNRLTILPPEIGRLIALQSLKLGNNGLTILPPEIGLLTTLRELDLSRNPGFPLPPEILKNPLDAQTIIRAWLDYLAGQKRPLNEVKLVLVGEGSVGKTSLVNRLLHDTFDSNAGKTEGIEIHKWDVSCQLSAVSDQSEGTADSKIENQKSKIRVNVWDFGGQEIMHATHQFFLTKRTLYVLVLDSRYSEAENRLDYWLTLIRSFGGDSPILVVGNKTDQHTLDLDRRGLLAKHLTVQDILDVSCVTGAGIPALQKAITQQIAAMPHVTDPITITWFDVKTKLEAMDVDYIPYADYIRLCREKNVDAPDSQRVLLGFLHDLGVVFHFPDPRLETTNILNPEWVTQGVYRILNTRLPFTEQGILTWDMLARILDDESYWEKRMFIADVMQKFELCYELSDRPNTYLIPDLLPKEAMDTGKWDDALRFEVHYPVLPGSILTRLIVRMHRFIKEHTTWRTGVLLICDSNEALVKADLVANRITIVVRGPGSGRRELLTRIRHELDNIHSTIADLRPEEKVPVPGYPEIKPVDYKWLRDLERKGFTEFPPPGITEMINVGKLLDGVELREVRRERDSKYEIHFHDRTQIGGIGDEHQVNGGINFGQAPIQGV